MVDLFSEAFNLFRFFYQMGIGRLFINIPDTVLKTQLSRVQNILRIQSLFYSFHDLQTRPQLFLDKGRFGHAQTMFRGQGPLIFQGEGQKILTDLAQGFPFLGFPHIHNEHGMEISITDMTEGGNGGVMFPAYFLDFMDDGFDLADRHSKIFDNRNLPVTRFDPGKGGNQPLSG